MFYFRRSLESRLYSFKFLSLTGQFLNFVPKNVPRLIEIVSSRRWVLSLKTRLCLLNTNRNLTNGIKRLLNLGWESKIWTQYSLSFLAQAQTMVNTTGNPLRHGNYRESSSFIDLVWKDLNESSPEFPLLMKPKFPEPRLPNLWDMKGGPNRERTSNREDWWSRESFSIIICHSVFRKFHEIIRKVFWACQNGWEDSSFVIWLKVSTYEQWEGVILRFADMKMSRNSKTVRAASMNGNCQEAGVRRKFWAGKFAEIKV
jgi:hypothetical protein